MTIEYLNEEKDKRVWIKHIDGVYKSAYFVNQSEWDIKEYSTHTEATQAAEKYILAGIC